MKRITLLAFLFLSILASSQNYKLFKPTSSKVYAALPLMNTTFSLKIDLISFNGNDSAYHFYKDISNQWINGDNCDFWGSQLGRAQNKPKWMGNRVLFDENHNYKFITLANDTLFMDFPQVQGASFNFYEDATQRFSITYEGKDTASILGVLDSVQNYRINHFNNLGDIIHSQLNDHVLMVGKTLGLIQFFQIDLFPTILNPLRLIGNTAPNVGLYQITQRMVYDYQPGDEIQYRSYYLKFLNGQFHYYSNNYTKYTFLERFDSVNKVTYTAIFERFNVDYTEYVSYTVNLVYRDDVVIINIPFDEINDGNTLMERSLSKLPYCSLNLMTYESSRDLGTGYCELKKCWGSRDCFGPPPTEIKTYVLGLGKYYDFYQKYSSGNQDKEEAAIFIIYFKKNGVICGDEIIVGEPEQMAVEKSFSVFPNPSTTS
ncbi:MAG: hypothetical protein Q8T08_23850, partial [Ignavibacteria bacterium]|nr:hypothetical protein [Ignavibacteria bacterium]